jgi:hypothetical protein
MMDTTDFYLIKQRYLATEKAHRDWWRRGHDQLVAEGRTLSPTSPDDYRRDLDDLDIAWQRIDAAYGDLEAAEADSWEDAERRWNETAETYRRHYLRTADAYWPKTTRPSWMAGYTERLTSESEGWLEGMGHQSHDSEGWTEGYEEVND